jgi:hypothetical protein
MGTSRYYLCDIIGDGQTTETAFRPAVADLGVTMAQVIPTDPVTGRPLFDWCLVLVQTDNHARVAALKGVDPLPDVSLDTQWNSVDKTRSDAARAALARRRVPAPAINPGDGYRHFIRGIGRQLVADFHEDGLGIPG